MWVNYDIKQIVPLLEVFALIYFISVAELSAENSRTGIANADR